MALDPSIALKAVAPQEINPMDSMIKAYTMKRLANESQIQDQQIADDQATRDAFKNNLITNPDGTTTVDKQAALSDLAKTSPMRAEQYQRTFQAQSAEDLSRRHAVAKDIAWSIPSDPNTPMEQKQAAWDQARADAIKNNLPGAAQSPQAYPGDDFVNTMKVHTLDADTQNKNQQDDKKLGEQIADRKDARNARAQQAAQRTQDRRDMLADKASQKNDQLDDKDMGKLNDALLKGSVGRSGQIGQIQAKINAAEAAEQLLAQGKQQDGGLDSRQIEELAQSTAKMLGGGASASQRVDALVPHTFWGRAQSAAEWASGNPRGADQQAFTDRMGETVSREKALATEQKRQYQIEALAGFDRLKKSNPDKYNSVLAAHGITPDMIDEKGQYVPESKRSSGAGSKSDSSAGGVAQDVKDYASKHGITVEQAQAIKDQRTAQ